ncbi:protein lifeguard 4-like [Acanthaster planci]|uniref:Protein lifeguard 4-like n=1 Tax=Acanthaster planci TaxID=133434 RepID=A0A8B7XHP0_ACAPL|nr:protein lifeguard 4-like [Acanthaster planci]XP_022080313.1 protein lifeguard 4-like [Acanthaster planci]
MATKAHDVESIVDDFRYSTNVATAHVSIRLGFLRKVFGILSTQLLVTTVVGAIFMYTDGVKAYVQSSQGMLIVAYVSSIFLLLALFVKRRESPTNMILLALFTLVEAYSVGTIVTFYNKGVVLEAFTLTLVVTLSLTAYTMQSKRDFSSWGAGLYSALLILIVSGLLHIFLLHSDTLEFLLAIFGALLFCAFIVFDVHMMMHKLSPEEYILASINLYLDILNLFLHILRILGEAQKK